MGQKKDNKESNYQSNELMQVNRLALIVVSFISVVLFFGYLQDASKGNITWGFAFLVAVLAAFCCVMNMIIYFRNKYSNVLRHSIIISYGLLYLVTMLGAKNDLVFIIAIPLISINMLYFDFRFIVSSSVGVFGVNLIYIIYRFSKGSMASGLPLETSTLLLHLLGVALYLVSVCEVTKISNRINSKKLEEIDQEKGQSENLLQDVLEIASAVKENSTAAGDKIASLLEATARTSEALEEISQGNASNASSIEKQTEMTGNIQNMITGTKNVSDEMFQYAKTSFTAIQEGQKSMEELLDQADFIEQSNQQVSALMQTLADNARQVGNITEEIFSISSQTNMLALNASIESARAGEAGRGFAVVAEQIRVLAEQTRTLTENIRSIVESLQENTDETLESVTKVLDASVKEKKSIGMAGEIFSDIYTKMTELGRNVQVVGDSIDEIYAANNQIVDSISQISAVSQEVAASTIEANNIGSTSHDEAEEAAAMMRKLLEAAGKLDRYL